MTNDSQKSTAINEEYQPDTIETETMMIHPCPKKNTELSLIEPNDLKKKETPMFQNNPPIFWVQSMTSNQGTNMSSPKQSKRQTWSLKTSHSPHFLGGFPLNAPQRLDSCRG